MPEESGKKINEPAGTPKREYGVGHRLIGKDYQTPDLYAKVTGQAKYAEDYHADGILQTAAQPAAACASKAH
jgi:hypothetical protein